MQRNEKTKFIKEAVSWNPEEIKKRGGRVQKDMDENNTERGRKKDFQSYGPTRS